jgi:hypothetical protein
VKRRREWIGRAVRVELGGRSDLECDLQQTEELEDEEEQQQCRGD